MIDWFIWTRVILALLSAKSTTCNKSKPYGSSADGIFYTPQFFEQLTKSDHKQAKIGAWVNFDRRWGGTS
jgi:hypothetical protein